MIYLTVEQVLRIHERALAEGGGDPGVRDMGLLESAVFRPQQSFGGQDLYPDVFTKAGALMHSLINNHPFVDGNKRTGLTATIMFLLRNGWRLSASQASIEDYTLQVAEGRWDAEEIAEWLEESCDAV